MPLADLLNKAQATDGVDSVEELKALTVLYHLMRWFKDDFFSWARQRVCEVCGGEMTVRNAIPMAQEIQEGDASRVEVYSCKAAPQKHPEQRFPRYNNARKLLETREGRCGEWSNCFCLIIASLNRPDGTPWFNGTRFVVDFTDHVFCEV